MTNKGLRAAREAARCGARTRDGGVCQNPGANGKTRCHQHGGGVNAAGRGSGAPKGNRNAVKHGLYCAATQHERMAMKRMIRVGRKAAATLRNG